MNLANKLTVLRLLLTPVFIILLFNPVWTIKTAHGDELNILAIVIFIFTIFTDSLDGFVARKKKIKTPLGTFLDPMADKLLLVTTFIALTYKGVIPLWVTIIVMSRDIILTVGWLLTHIFTGYKTIAPSPLGKATTFFQMFTVFFGLCHFSFTWFFWWAAALFTIASGVDYVSRGLKVLNHEAVKK